MSELKLPFIITNVIPEFDTAVEDELMKNVREYCVEAEDEIFVERLADLYRDSLPPPPEVKCRPKKSVHAIAHFDFDGSCHSCPFSNFEGNYCDFMREEIDSVPCSDRHEHCPLCIEED